MNAMHLFLVGCALLCVGEVISIVGVATTHWIDLDGIDYYRSHNIKYIGLFQQCDTQLFCDDLTSSDGDLNAVRAMVILGLLGGCVSIASATLILVRKMTQKPVSDLVRKFAMVASIGGFVFTIIGIAVYRGDIYNDMKDDYVREDIKLGYSFTLTIVGGVLVAAGGLLVFFGGSQTPSGENDPLLGNPETDTS